ncbi:MAG TPA: hypothetical protein VN942_01395 [Chthoniobacterales bacterium]|nr:hypothetical protein [Chthoniobacterales bacterium]
MAKKSGNNKSDAELKEQIARSREDLALRLNRVREEVDLPRRIRRSVRREPVRWIVGAIAVGLLVTAVLTRKKKVIVDAKGGTKSKHPLLEAGFVLGALRIAASLLKPVVINLVEKKLRSYSGRGRFGPKGF